MKVLRVVGGLDPRIGGPVQSTLLSTLATVEAGVEVELVTSRWSFDDEPVLRRLAEGGVAVRGFRVRGGRVGRRGSFSPALIWWLVRNVRRFHVVHAHGAWTATSLAGLVVARAMRVPFVLTPHESLTDHDVAKGPLPTRLVKRGLRRVYLGAAQAVVFASSLELDDSCGAGRAHVVSHPVEPSQPTERRRAEVEPLHVGFLGRFDPKKNLDLLFAALPHQAELVVAGDGTPSARSAMRAAADRAGVGDRVTWLGFVEGEAKQRFFDVVDVLAMPSRYECFGMAAAEALAAGVPVIVSRSTGIAPVVQRHDCGFVVDSEIASLRSALAERDALREKGTRARAAAVAEFAPGSHGEALVRLYRSLVA